MTAMQEYITPPYSDKKLEINAYLQSRREIPLNVLLQ